MFRSLLHFSPVILTSAILIGVVPASNPGSVLGSAAQDAAPAQAAPAAPGPKNPVKPTAESQAKAKKTYGFDCALCHNANGDGKTDLAKDMQLALTDMTDPKTLASKSDSEIFDIIRKGKDKMPPEDAARAKDDDVWNLVIYVRALSKGSPAAAAVPTK